MLKSSLAAMLVRMQAQLPVGRWLEVGPGSVQVGLQLLRNHPDLDLVSTGLTPVESDQLMAESRLAQVADRVRVVPFDLGKRRLALEDQSVDGVVSFGALRSWRDLGIWLDEIGRVLKTQGPFFLGDARPDAGWFSSWLAGQTAGLKAVYRSTRAAWPKAALQEVLPLTELARGRVEEIGPDVWIVSA